MKKQKILIDNIPAILWGQDTGKLFIAVHGNMSHKEDDAIAVFATQAIKHGYQVLSFDLPQHGERKNEEKLCNVENCVEELQIVFNYCKSITTKISLYAVSIGAYFSLVAYKHEELETCLLLSPIVDMERIINNIMNWFGITESQLEKEQEVPTPIGHTLYWNYYCYVKEHPIKNWKPSTAILYGEKDDQSEFDVVNSFSQKFGCKLTIQKDGEHYFHTKEQLDYLSSWVNQNIN